MSRTTDELTADLKLALELCNVVIAELQSYDEANAILISDDAALKKPVTIIGDLDRGTLKLRRESGAILIRLDWIERTIEELERSLAVNERVAVRRDRWNEFTR